ncbi:MAG TPA: metal-dependent hydrolase [Candidatus Paceibacterota bacterium]|jgi:membrane-bound metal-dependent hydrolase YbcI (DUF457 family)|nr:metal-dependent hydrolase [Candidatus Paceibacterota bacterium]
MVLPGHLAGGYLAATAMLSFFQPSLSPHETAALLIIGTIAGDLPDIDLIFFYLKHRKDRTEKHPTSESESHRNYITHIPFFWFVLSLLISLIGTLFDSTLIMYAGLVIFGGTWSHLILDSIDYGIRWIAPLSQRRYALKKEIPKQISTDRPGSLMQYIHFILQTYWRMPTFWAEIGITIFTLHIVL